MPGLAPALAGQHVDVRLTAEDGYTAQRSYSLSSAAGAMPIELTVERFDDGEVSPYLVDELEVGDSVEVRGPVGGWLVWRPDADSAPVQLIAGGSGVAPLMSMLRTRAAAGSERPFRLLYGVTDPDRVYYAEELAELARTGVQVDLHYSRRTPPGSLQEPGRLTPDDVARLTIPAADQPEVFVLRAHRLRRGGRDGARRAGPPGGARAHGTLRPDRLTRRRPRPLPVDWGLRTGLPLPSVSTPHTFWGEPTCAIRSVAPRCSSSPRARSPPAPPHRRRSPHPAAAVQVVAGDGALTASWAAIPGAARYAVRIAATRGPQHARTVSTAQRTIRVGGLRNGTSYAVRVTPVGGAIGLAAARTGPAPVVTTASAGVPLPVSAVTVAAGPQPNQLQVTWTGGDRALKVGLVAGSNVTVTERAFHSAWYPATTRSIILTVPEQYRTAIGAGTGSPIYVRVVQSNSAATRFHPTFDLADKYRASPVGSWAFAKAPDATGAVSRLRVAELNTQTNGATDRYSRDNQWISRAPRVAALIESASPDLLLTAELSTNADEYDRSTCNNTAKEPYRCAGLTQYLQLAGRLSTLRLADPDAYDRVLDQMKGFGGSRFLGKVTDGAHVLYDPEKLTLLDHGFFSPALKPSEGFANVTGLGVPGWEQTPDIGGDRWMTWARFRTTDDAHREFYAVSAHLPVGDSTPIVAVRAKAAEMAEAAISRMAGSLPIVFGGDFNADPTRNPNPAHAVFMSRGWFDSAAVPDPSQRFNMRYNTANGSGPQTGADPGYPVRPYLQKWPTSRIDYILLKNSPHTYRYENVLRTDADGTFVRAMQGSDHNMQVAEIGIGDPVG